MDAPDKTESKPKRVLTPEEIKRIREERKRKALLTGGSSRLSTITVGSIETERQATQEALQAQEQPCAHEPEIPVARDTISIASAAPQTKTPSRTPAKKNTTTTTTSTTNTRASPTTQKSSSSLQIRTFQVFWMLFFAVLTSLFGSYIALYVPPLVLAVVVHAAIGAALMPSKNYGGNQVGDKLWYLEMALAGVNYFATLFSDLCICIFLTVALGLVFQQF